MKDHIMHRVIMRGTITIKVTIKDIMKDIIILKVIINLIITVKARILILIIRNLTTVMTNNFASK